jgi:hypothetical protein
MSILSNCTLKKDNISCEIYLEFYENSYIIMITEGDSRSTEMRYFKDEKTAREIFSAIKNRKIKDGWK